VIIPTAEPFFFPGGPTGCLLVHGFTGSPKEMRFMGEALHREGYSVLGVRLAGHATRQEDMLRTRWQDWVASVEDGWHLLSGAAEQIVVAGLSMGGILSLLFASPQFAGRCPVAGVIAMSTPYDLVPDPRLPFIRLLHPLIPQVQKGSPDWCDPQVALNHIDYPAYPTRAIVELRDLMAEMRLALPGVTVPTLLMHARGDSGGGFFDPQSMEKIHAALGSQDKAMLWIENSGHVVTCDLQCGSVFLAASNFVRRVTPLR
jgi:carboxylesterase